MPVKIHGKEYKTVAERLNEAHNEHDQLEVHTDLLSMESGIWVVQATVKTPKGTFQGLAFEVEAGIGINKTSALENAETSAVGRALAFAGYAGSEIASANEVENAVKQQNQVEIKKLTKVQFKKRLEDAFNMFMEKGITGKFENYLNTEFGTAEITAIVKDFSESGETILAELAKLYKEG